MIRHRLYLQIYVAFVLMAMLAAATAATLGHFIHGPGEPPPPVARAAQLLGEKLPGVDPQREVDALGDRLGVDVGVFGPAGEPVAAHGRRVPPPRPDGPDAQWVFRPGGPAVVARLEDGRWLGVGYAWREGGQLHLALALSALFGVTALGCYPIVRRITRRIEDLQAGVEAWGAGRLDVRVTPRGEDEVAQLATSFNAAADRVSALVDGQRRMLASASHELRSPLARLRMAVELLDGDEALKAGAARDIEELDQLVGDLLLSSRAQAGAMLRVEVDLGALVAEEAARVGATAGGAGRVHGDAAMLRRLVRNLLENARRHGGPNVRATVDGGRIVVEDDGPGVAEAERERIWEPFYRPAGHHEGGDGGVGLGLALVREIARQHGGTARLEAGSRFVVDLDT